MRSVRATYRHAGLEAKRIIVTNMYCHKKPNKRNAATCKFLSKLMYEPTNVPESVTRPNLHDSKLAMEQNAATVGAEEALPVVSNNAYCLGTLGA